MNHIRPIGHMDVAPLILAAREDAERFGDLTFRQATPGSPHRDTETIYLRMPPEISFESIFEGMEVVDYHAHPVFHAAVWALAGLVGAKPARAMVIDLKAGGVITPHIDEGGYALATERWHLPIVTNPSAWLMAGGEKAHLQPGTVYWFDKQAPHEGANEGTTGRIHLVVDTWKDLG